MAIQNGSASLVSRSSMFAGFVYSGDGIMSLTGCAITSSNNCYSHLYSEDDVVYICDSARRKGKLEPVAIRHVKFKSKGRGVVFLIYVDTFNATYLEPELCTLVGANNLISIFVQQQTEELQEEIAEFTCT